MSQSVPQCPICRWDKITPLLSLFTAIFEGCPSVFRKNVRHCLTAKVNGPSMTRNVKNRRCICAITYHIPKANASVFLAWSRWNVGSHTWSVFCGTCGRCRKMIPSVRSMRHMPRVSHARIFCLPLPHVPLSLHTGLQIWHRLRRFQKAALSVFTTMSHFRTHQHQTFRLQLHRLRFRKHRTHHQCLLQFQKHRFRTYDRICRPPKHQRHICYIRKALLR